MISGAAIKGGVVGLVVAIALLPASLDAVARWRTAQAAEARLGATLARVPAAPPALDATVARVRAAAARGGVLVEQADAGSGRLRLRLSGAQRAVIALADGLERDGLQFVRWSLAIDGGALRLDGEAVAASARPSAPLARAYARSLFGAGENGIMESDAAPPDAPELVGVAGRIGRDAVALVRAADGATRTLAIGEGVDGWTLESLAIDAAFFTRGGQRARVPLPTGE